MFVIDHAVLAALDLDPHRQIWIVRDLYVPWRRRRSDARRQFDRLFGRLTVYELIERDQPIILLDRCIRRNQLFADDRVHGMANHILFAHTADALLPALRPCVVDRAALTDRVPAEGELPALRHD